MPSVPPKAAARIAAALKKFQPVLEDGHRRDINESDTVTIVTDLLCELFGYEKYGEITSEHAVRGTFCDITVKVDGKLAVLIEVKAIGSELKDSHVKQAIDYAANEGCEWVALTNGQTWHAYRVTFSKPIQADLVLDFNLLTLNHRKAEDVDMLGLLAREAWQKSTLEDYAAQKQALSRFTVAATILSEASLGILRRELKRISPDIRLDPSDIERVLVNEVIKREVLEGDRAEAAKRLVTKAARRSLRTTEKEDEEPPPDPSTGTPSSNQTA